MKMISLRTLVLPTVLALSVAACGDNGDDNGETDTMDTDDTMDTSDTNDTDDTGAAVDDTIVGIASSTPRFSVLVEAVTKAGLAGALNNVTVFAPNNDAFTALIGALDGVDSLDDLTAEQLVPILKYHVVAGEVDAAAAISVANGDGEASALGGTLGVSVVGDDLFIDDAKVLNPDIIASNGIIHEIDAVMLPDLVDIVTTDDDLSTLNDALLAVDGAEGGTDLVGTLGDLDAEYTVFAPVNSAFGDMLTANSAADLDAFVTAVGVGTVRDVLTYHVFAGLADSGTVVDLDGDSVTTLGGDVTVDLDGGSVILNDGVVGVAGTNTATVTVVDILASNGIIHKLNKVITPAAE